LENIPLCKEGVRVSKSNQTLGGILILVGLAGLLGHFFDFHIFSMARLWPLFILVPGLAFEYGYFSKRQAPGLLVPGGILMTLGIVFLIQTYTNWVFAGYMWPFYILAPAIGLFQFYLFGGHNRGLLVPVGILTTVAVCGFLGSAFSFINRSMIWPIALIVAGLIILTGKGNETAK